MVISLASAEADRWLGWRGGQIGGILALGRWQFRNLILSSLGGCKPDFQPRFERQGWGMRLMAGLAVPHHCEGAGDMAAAARGPEVSSEAALWG